MQYHSLEAQRKHFEKYISERTWWVFVGIYADQASGRHNIKMREFQRMMDDCRAGKIDLINQPPWEKYRTILTGL
jgi:DNA invertase Pin-like site-specific DNA recombinase